MTFNDYSWQGSPALVSAGLAILAALPNSADFNVIGPVIIAGVAYIKIRCPQTLTLPGGHTVSLAATSDSFVGVWL